MALTVVVGVMVACFGGSHAWAGAATPGYTYTVSSPIGVGEGPFGVAVDPGTHTAYVTNFDSHSVSVVDEASGTVTHTISTGSQPWGAAVDPGIHTVFVTNPEQRTVSVIDETSNAVTATIGVGIGAYGVAVDPVSHSAYVTNEDDHTVSVIDAATMTVTHTIDVGSFSSPVAAAVDPATHRVYVAALGLGAVVVIDATTDTVLRTISVGRYPNSVAIDPTTNTAYVTNQDGTVSVINEASNTVTSTVIIGTSPNQLNLEGASVDPNSLTVFVTSPDNDTVSIIDEATSSVTNTVAVGAEPYASAVDPINHIAVVTNGDGASTSLITQFAPVVAVRSGSGQSTAVGQLFGTPLVATVRGHDGNPVPGTTVTFTVTSGAADFAGGANTTATTDSSGVATSRTLEAGYAPGPVTVLATTGTASTTFNETVTALVPPTVDIAGIGDQRSPATTVSAFLPSTHLAGDVLLAFVSADGPVSKGGQKVSAVTGAGLSWTLVARSNATGGTAEVWQAKASGIVPASTVTAALAAAYDASITVTAFAGARPVTNAATASGTSGPPTVTLKPTRSGSLVFAAGHDWSQAITISTLAGQSTVHNVYDTRSNDTYWQQQVVARTTARSPLTVGAYAPATDRWQLTAVEIPPAS